MEQIKKLPVDFNTWKQMDFEPLYYVANSAIKFYKNQLTELNLTDENRNILRESIVKIEKMLK